MSEDEHHLGDGDTQPLHSSITKRLKQAELEEAGKFKQSVAENFSKEAAPNLVQEGYCLRFSILKGILIRVAEKQSGPNALSSDLPWVQMPASNRKCFLSKEESNIAAASFDQIKNNNYFASSFWSWFLKFK